MQAEEAEASEMQMHRFKKQLLCVCGMQMKLTDQPTMQVSTSKATHKLQKQTNSPNQAQIYSQQEAQIPRHKMCSRAARRCTQSAKPRALIPE